MSASYDNRFLPVALVAVIGCVVGLAAAASLKLALIVAVLGIGVACLAVPAFYWGVAAIILAVVFPGLTDLGLPGFASYLHFPLVFGGLVIAVVRYHERSRLADIMFGILGLLALSCALSTIFSGAEPMRGLFSFVVLAEPIALIAIFCAEPPDDDRWRQLKYVLLALVIIQIPVAYLQVASVGLGSLLRTGLADQVKGTVGITGGADVLAAIAAIGGIWLLALPRFPGRLAAMVALFALPFLAAANKVILAFPAIVVASPNGARLTMPIRVAVGTLSIIAVIVFANLLPGYLLPSVENSLSTESGKGQALSTAWDAIEGSPGTLAFGAGPADTVSGAAYLSVDPLRKEHSPIALLGIQPSQTAIELGALETATSSFTRPRSSTIGTLGDLGFFGLGIYLAFLGVLFRRLYAIASPEATAAVSGLLMVVIFGIVSTGWELPSLTLFVGGLCALALLSIPGRLAKPTAHA